MRFHYYFGRWIKTIILFHNEKNANATITVAFALISIQLLVIVGH